MNNDIKLLQLAKEVSNIVDKDRVYSANVFFELGVNENAHSRILRMILQYDDGSLSYPLFNSFLSIPKIKNVIGNLEYRNLKFANEEERIDLLIEGDNAFAIVVENKVCDAIDQDAQIERYIECVRNHDIDCSKIYVIYLTKDGSKEINNRSLTPKAKEVLCYTLETNGRFIPLNYKYDILPWLEMEMLSIKGNNENEQLLRSALVQYVDYLKEILGIKNDKENEEIMDLLKEKLNIRNIQDCINNLESLNVLVGKLNKLKDAIANDLGNKYIENSFNKFLKTKGVGYDVRCKFSYGDINIVVTHEKWLDFYFCVNSESPMIYGIANRDVSNPCKMIDFQSFESKMFKSSPCWPAYKDFGRIDLSFPNNLEFWKKVESGEFERYLEEKFSEVLGLLKLE